MTKCNTLFTKYGGHKMAAGLSLPEENVDTFRKSLNENCRLTEDDFQEKVLIDVPMPMDYVTMDFIEELDLLEPFGNGNTKPQFAQKNVKFIHGQILGVNRNVGKYLVSTEAGREYELMYFGNIEGFNNAIVKKYGNISLEALYQRMTNNININFSVVYYPEINEYKGKHKIQMIMKYYQ
jgi:single-stranded-DNA-specific exonuclease